jgi:hypothetical protein
MSSKTHANFTAAAQQYGSGDILKESAFTFRRDDGFIRERQALQAKLGDLTYKFGAEVPVIDSPQFQKAHEQMVVNGYRTGYVQKLLEIDAALESGGGKGILSEKDETRLRKELKSLEGEANAIASTTPTAYLPTAQLPTSVRIDAMEAGRGQALLDYDKQVEQKTRGAGVIAGSAQDTLRGDVYSNLLEATELLRKD